jgi:hypothetical protein
LITRTFTFDLEERGKEGCNNRYSRRVWVLLLFILSLALIGCVSNTSSILDQNVHMVLPSSCSSWPPCRISSILFLGNVSQSSQSTITCYSIVLVVRVSLSWALVLGFASAHGCHRSIWLESQYWREQQGRRNK